jgi:hypothetical protein
MNKRIWQYKTTFALVFLSLVLPVARSFGEGSSSPQLSAPAMTETTHATDSNDYGAHVLTEFIIAEVRPEAKVDHQTATELGPILKRPVDRIERLSAGELLQLGADSVSADQLVPIVCLLNPGDYVRVLATPRLLARTGHAEEVRIGDGSLPFVISATAFNLRLTVVAERQEEKREIGLDADIDLQLVQTLSAHPDWMHSSPNVPVLRHAVTTKARLQAVEGKWVMEPIGGTMPNRPADPNTRIIYLMARFNTIKSPAAASGTETTFITRDRVTTMLSRRLTVDDLFREIGAPATPVWHLTSWGRLDYSLPDVKRHVSFTCKGKYVIGAWYADTRIEGVTPATHELRVGYDGTGGYRFWFDNEVFGTLDALKTRLAAIPGGSIIEYLRGDDGDPGRPLMSVQDVTEFALFCECKDLAFCKTR